MTTRSIDYNALRTNQISIIMLLALSFVLNAIWLVALVAVVMLIGSAFPRAALFQRFYHRVLKSVVKPDIHEDNREPHLFAQALGGTFTLLAFLTLYAGIDIIGWSLVWFVIGLAALNLTVGFCAGCFVYYQLSKRGIFKQQGEIA